MPSSQPYIGIFTVAKTRGETLAVLLERFRREHDLGPDTKITYAGRLDPMAEGLVVILAGDARFQKDKMLGLSKTYTMEILLGVSTDTHDPLGIVGGIAFASATEGAIADVVNRMTGIATLPYPMYSSVPVQGKPLFMHAREGTQIDIPNKKVKISDVSLVSIEKRPLKEIISYITEDVARVEGDFRQQDIISSWEHIRTVHPDAEVTIVTIEAHVSSGTYMRSLAEWMGTQLGVPALAYRIVRTKLGGVHNFVILH